MSSPSSSCASKVSVADLINLKTASIVRCYNVEWQVDNYSFRVNKSVGESIQSSKFTTGANTKTEWVLRLYPKGFDSPGQVVVRLLNISKFGSTVKFTISVLDCGRTKIRSCEAGLIRILSGQSFGPVKALSTPEELLKGDGTLLSNDTLTIHLELQTFEEIGDSCFQGAENSLARLSGDLEKLREASEFSDVTISVDGKVFPVHKSILAARSPVFDALFKSGLEESKSNAVDILDVEPGVMEVFLRYIYTGKCERIDEMAAALLRMADKYDIKCLKDLCEIALLKQMNCENAADTLIVADLYNAEDLKGKILDFIKKNIKEVTASESWKNMGQSHSLLELEVLRAITYGQMQIKYTLG